MKYTYIVRMADRVQIEEAKRYCAENSIKYEFHDRKHVFSYTDFHFASKKDARQLLDRFDTLPFYSSEDLKGMVSIY